MDARKASVGGAVGKRQLKQFVLIYVYTCVAERSSLSTLANASY
jgi:hypothetical protein